MELETDKANTAGASASKGRVRRLKRLAVVLLAMLAFVAVIPFLIRAILISGIPDVGDPFDVKAFALTEVPEGENGFTWYRRAATELKPPTSAVETELHYIKLWSDANPVVRSWLENNRDALNTFRRGSECPSGQSHRPMEYSEYMSLATSFAVRTFVQLAILEAYRREDAGDLSGAWDLYNGVLCASRHVMMHGCIYERQLGMEIHSSLRDPILRWSTHPELNKPQLLQAVTDLQAGFQLTPLRSNTLKVEYIWLQNTFRDPMLLRRYRDLTQFESALGISFVETWIGQMGLYFSGEPTMSQRAVQLVFANQLLQCDLPPTPGAPPTRGELHLYSPNPSLSSRKQFTPTEIEGYCSQTFFARQHLYYTTLFHFIDQEEARQADLVMALAVQAYFRTHGEFPAQLDALLDGYLEEPALAPYGTKGNWLYYKRTAEGASLLSVTIKTPTTMAAPP